MGLALGTVAHDSPQGVGEEGEATLGVGHAAKWD